MNLHVSQSLFYDHWSHPVDRELASLHKLWRRSGVRHRNRDGRARHRAKLSGRGRCAGLPTEPSANDGGFCPPDAEDNQRTQS